MFRLSTLAGFMSYPMVMNLVENSLARGSPTYPSPMTAIFIFSVMFSVIVLRILLNYFSCCLAFVRDS